MILVVTKITGLGLVFFSANHLTTLLSGHLGTSSSTESQKILLRFMSNKKQIKTFSGSKDIDLEIDGPPNSLHNHPISDQDIFMKESVFYYQKLTETSLNLPVSNVIWQYKIFQRLVCLINVFPKLENAQNGENDTFFPMFQTRLFYGKKPWKLICGWKNVRARSQKPGTEEILEKYWFLNF